jgi:hypothetical protein
VCVCVFVCVCMFVCLCVFMCVYVCTCICVWCVGVYFLRVLPPCKVKVQSVLLLSVFG